MLRTHRLMTVLMLTVTIALGSALPALAHGPRLVVRLSEPFEVAGRVYPAGSLTLRPVVDYNPNTSFDEVWIGNDCLGLLVAERCAEGRPSSRDTVIFERNSVGRLALVGYVLRGRGDHTTYRYRATAVHAEHPAVEGEDMLAAR